MSRYVREKGCFTFYTNRETPCSSDKRGLTSGDNAELFCLCVHRLSVSQCISLNVSLNKKLAEISSDKGGLTSRDNAEISPGK